MGKNKAAVVGGSVLVILIIAAILAPIIAPYSPREMSYGNELLPPGSEGYLLGTTSLAQDVLSYVVYGLRISLYVGFGTLLLEVALALTVGGLSGYFGGVIDELLMRFTEIVMTIPPIILLITGVSMFGTRSLEIIILFMALVNWPWMARVVRAEIMSRKQEPFIEEGRSMGFSELYLLVRYIFPTVLSPVIVLGTLDVAWFILYEATLSFLGLGDPTSTSLGILVSMGRDVLTSGWWVSFIPAFLIFLLVISLNLLGDGLRDALDVRENV
ncbi:ABC transporter permease [Candidatus Bipolaricaulota bacterium]|nr:ABC transporter permease [Candidatus Bipolaricaulota bacterium]